jgi:arylsulfatase A-like enzyme
MTLWFGLVAGWLDLGLVQAQRAFYPHVTNDILRTNRHLTWMVPASQVLIFAIVGLTIAAIARLRWGPARWAAWRLPAALCLLALVLEIEGLYGIACVCLAAGFGLRIGGWLERRGESFLRLVRMSLPAMLVLMAAWTGLSYVRVETSEQRILARRPPAKAGAPNVLLIVLDTVRAACLSLHGHERRTTPNLDRLAARGMIFSQARSTAPWTAPSHGSIMTGRWPHELSVRPGVPLDATFPTLAEVLGREGYATAGFVGNVYFCNASYGLDRGFARYEDAYENRTISLLETLQSTGLGRRLNRLLGYPRPLEFGEILSRKSAEMLNRDVLGWLAGRPADRPFFVFLNYYDAHVPYVFYEDPALRFGAATLPASEQSRIDQRFQDLIAKDPAPSELTPSFIAEATEITQQALRLYHDSYDSCIAYVDRQLGLLLDEMERRGLLENTLVIVTSDHGEQIGEHGKIAHAASVYREEVHVPLLLIPPAGCAHPATVQEPVSLREIAATVAEYGAPGASRLFPGRSLTRFLGDGAERSAGDSPVLSELQHNVVFGEKDGKPPLFRPVKGLLWRHMAYIRGDDRREELYDLANDPEERNNLAEHSRLQRVVQRLRRDLDRLVGPPDPAVPGRAVTERR